MVKTSNNLGKKQLTNYILEGNSSISLPVLKVTNTALSCWKLNFFERICVLFLGRIFVCQKGIPDVETGLVYCPIWLKVFRSQAIEEQRNAVINTKGESK
jgi:hypothetical protein